MPSSTSSSEPPPESTSHDRAPEGPWGRIWLSALLGALLLFGGWELYWRLQGFRPVVQDDAELWALVRARADGPDKVVLVGSSRMHADVDLDEFAAATGQRPVQLALANTHPLPILENLAADPGVSGIVICGVAPSIFFDPSRLADERAHEYVRYYRESLASPSKRIEAWCSTWVECLTVSSAELRPHNVIRALRAGHRPEPETSHVKSFGRDRQQLLSFDDPEIRRARAGWVADFREARPAQPSEMEQLLDKTRRSVQRIRSRGGHVVFVRFPSDGEVARQERRQFPRDRYWERLASIEGAFFVHADDRPELQPFRTAEGSHLDYRAARSFTRSLVTVVREELSRDGQVETIASTAN